MRTARICGLKKALENVGQIGGEVRFGRRRDVIWNPMQGFGYCPGDAGQRVRISADRNDVAHCFFPASGRKRGTKSDWSGPGGGYVKGTRPKRFFRIQLVTEHLVDAIAY